MKIFNVENQKEKVYVQIEDIMQLIKSCKKTMPQSIISNFFNNLICHQENKSAFVELTAKEEIEFLRSVDWIVDYREIYSLQSEEVSKLVETEINKRELIATKYNRLSPLAKLEKGLALKTECELYDYKINSIVLINQMKRANVPSELPIVPDYKGFVTGLDDTEDTIAMSSLDHTKLIIYRKDGKEINKSYKLSESYIKKVITLFSMYISNKNEYFSEFIPTLTISSDSKYFILDINMISQYEIEKRDEGKKQKQICIPKLK